MSRQNNSTVSKKVIIHKLGLGWIAGYPAIKFYNINQQKSF